MHRDTSEAPACVTQNMTDAGDVDAVAVKIRPVPVLNDIHAANFDDSVDAFIDNLFESVPVNFDTFDTFDTFATFENLDNNTSVIASDNGLIDSDDLESSLPPRFAELNDDRLITFITWNATGLRNRVNDLILYMQRYSVDFAVVSETWLRPGDNLPFICRKEFFHMLGPSWNAR